MRINAQRRSDQGRKLYKIMFPSNLSLDRVPPLLRAIGGSLRGPNGGFLPNDPSIVFHMEATDREVTHYILVPWQCADYIVGQLRTIIPGARVEPAEQSLARKWMYGNTIGMTYPDQPLNIPSPTDLAASILSTGKTLIEGEVLAIQTVLQPYSAGRLPNKGSISTEQQSWRETLLGQGARQLTADELSQRRDKLNEPNFLACIRVGAIASTEGKARHLVENVKTAFAGTRNGHVYLRSQTVRPGEFIQAMNTAATPPLFAAQLSISEAAALLAWPPSGVVMAGLSYSGSRHLPATEAVPRDGRIIGVSNFPGGERPLAIDYESLLRHVYVLGPTGTGKTTLLANMAAQDMAGGFGVIVMESKGDLFNTVLNYVPRERINDVVVLNVADMAYPVGFNLLEQGNPQVVADQVSRLIQRFYQDTRGIWMQRWMQNGQLALADYGGATFTDLLPLISPDADEKAWSEEVLSNARDREVRRFVRQWRAMKPDERSTAARPLENRLFQFSVRPEIRNIIGQSKSSFLMDDVIRDNKILLINLAGIPEETSTLLGTLLLNAIWSSAQRVRTDRPNFLYMDEFQSFMNLDTSTDEMLAKARSFKLGMTLANQNLGQLPPQVRSAVMHNARSKVVFQTTSEDARAIQNEFSRLYLDESDLIGLANYEAFAKIMTPSGVSAPITMLTKPPLRTTGYARQVIEASRRTYGRHIDQVEREMDTRRRPRHTTRRTSPTIG